MFLKKKVDFNQILSELISSYSLVVDPQKIIKITFGRLREFFDVEELELFLRNDNNNFQNVADKTLIFSNAKLVNWLNINKKPLEISAKSYDYLEDCHSILKKYNPNIIFPVISHNKLKGIILLKAKKKYNAETKEFIQNIFRLFGLAYNTAKHIQKERKILNYKHEKKKMAVIDRMASFLAHEIKNPLTSIRSSIQLIGSSLENKQYKEITEGLLEEVDRVNEITNSILKFSRPQPLHIGSVKIIKLVKSIYSIFQAKLKDNGIIFTYPEKEYLNLEIEGDEDAFRQILQNFMLNSIAAVSESERKRITANIIKENSRFTFEWKDTGRGIPELQINKIFEPFFTTKKKGTGLGLAITKKLLEKQYYDLKVNSKPGTGTRFFFDLNVIKTGKSW